MNRMKATGAAAALMLAVGTLGGVSTTATAAPTEPAPASPTKSEQVTLARVTDNNVIFRDAPGGQPLGQVHEGQQGWAHCYMQFGTESWVLLDLWGGPANVWIHDDYVVSDAYHC